MCASNLLKRSGNRPVAFTMPDKGTPAVSQRIVIIRVKGRPIRDRMALSGPQICDLWRCKCVAFTIAA